MKPFVWGLVGPGRIARTFARGVRDAEGCRIGAVASRDPQRAAEFAAEWGIPTQYGSYEELFSDPSIDGVYIATPHRYHYTQARDALLAGKPVLCEKPLTVFPGDAKKLTDLARTKGLFLMEALWTRFLPAWRIVTDIVGSGLLGELRYAESSFGIRPAYDPEDRKYNPALAGGALLDVGIYNLAMTQLVLGNPVTWNSEGILTPTGVDASIHGTLHYPHGAMARFSCSVDTPMPNMFSLSGDKGSLRIGPMFHAGSSLEFWEQGKTTSWDCSYTGGGFQFQILEAVKCIRTGLVESPRMPHADSLHLQDQMESMLQAAGVRYPFGPAE